MIAVAAMAMNRTIGRDGKLPWSPIQEDLAHFRNITMDKHIIVGRKTFETLPKLQDRKIHVLTRKLPSLFEQPNPDAEFEYIDGSEGSCHVLSHRLPDAVVCGGAEVYKTLLPYCSELYLTLVFQNLHGDTFMPPFLHEFWKKEIILLNDQIEISRHVRI